MIQGGGFTPEMAQKKTQAEIKNEADNGLKNLRGTLAMARTQVVDSASSQFFINLADNDFLNHQNKTANGYGYAVLAKSLREWMLLMRLPKRQLGIVAIIKMSRQKLLSLKKSQLKKNSQHLCSNGSKKHIILKQFSAISS
jgi:cyclophilin family peptidyl-prolyl cis-trans isomerase